MPSVITTIDQILPLIPQSEPLRAELQAFRDGVFLELPEGNRHLWVQAQQIIAKMFPWPDLKYEDVRAWQVNVAEIWQESVGRKSQNAKRLDELTARVEALEERQRYQDTIDMEASERE